MKRLLLLLFISGSAVLAQPAFRIDPNPATTTAGQVSPTGYPALYALQGATVYLYTDPAATILAQTYVDATGTSTCPKTAQIVEPGSICTSTAGVLGNFGWWVFSGSYWYTINAQGQQYGPYPITATGGGIPAPPFGSTQINNQGALGGALPLNVLGAGVKADGKVDDTVAWNSIFSSMLTTGGVITFPSNTGQCSMISAPIKIGNGTIPIDIEFSGQNTGSLENTPRTSSCIQQTNPAQDIVDITYGGNDALTLHGLVLNYAQPAPNGTASVVSSTLTPVTGSVNGGWFVPGGRATIYVEGSTLWTTPCQSANCVITSSTAGSNYVSPQFINDNGYSASAVSAAINQSSYAVLNWQQQTTGTVSDGVLALRGTSPWTLVSSTAANSFDTTGTGSTVTIQSLPVTSRPGDTLIIVASIFQAGSTPTNYSSMTANPGDTVVPCPLNILSGATVYNTMYNFTGNVTCGYVLSTVGGSNVTFNDVITSVAGKLVGGSVYVLEYSAGTVTYDSSNASSNIACSTSCAAPTLSPSGTNDLYLQMMVTGQGNTNLPLGFGPPGSLTVNGNCTVNCPTSGSPTHWAVGAAVHAIGTQFQVGTSMNYVTVANGGVGVTNDPDSVSSYYEHMSYHNNFIGVNDGGSQNTVIDKSVIQGGFIGWNSEEGLVEGLTIENTVIESQKGPQVRTGTQVFTPHFLNVWNEFPGDDMYQVKYFGTPGTLSPGFIYGTWTNCRFNSSSGGSGNVFNIVDPGLLSSSHNELTIIGGFVVNGVTPFNFTAINGSSHGTSDPQNSSNPGYTSLRIIGTQLPNVYQLGGLYTLSQSLTTYFFDVPNFVTSHVPANFYTSTFPSYLSLGVTGITINGISQPPFLYSAAGTPLPTCNAGIKGSTAAVLDATGPTYLGTYTSGGTVTAGVVCNGSNWVTR